MPAEVSASAPINSPCTSNTKISHGCESAASAFQVCSGSHYSFLTATPHCCNHLVRLCCCRQTYFPIPDMLHPTPGTPHPTPCMTTSKVMPATGAAIPRVGVGAGKMLPEGRRVQAGVGHKRFRRTVLENRDRAGPPQEVPQDQGQEGQATEEEGGVRAPGGALGHLWGTTWVRLCVMDSIPGP